MVVASAGTTVLAVLAVSVAGRWSGAGHAPWALVALLTGVAVLAGGALGAAFVAGPVERDLARLADAVRTSSTAVHVADVEPELGPLQAAVSSRLDLLEAEFDELTEVARTSAEVIETSPFGILLIDADGRIASTNPTLRRILPLRGDPIGRRPIEVVLAVEVHEMVEEVVATGQPVQVEFVTASKDLVGRAQPIARGHVIVRIEDVTGRREAERARTDFVANVSHELRTPVSAIMGYVETVLLDAERMPPDLVPLVSTIERNARRLRDLFEDLLRLHRIEARRRELPVQRRPLASLLEEALVPAMDRAQSRHQEFVLSCDPSIEAMVSPEALTAIVSNLAINASMYTPEGGRIEVRVVPDGREVRVDVQDNGIGIAEKHHERIWERFYRVDDARSRKAGGTGLGLAIVKHYALAARHPVTLKSKDGEGSTFSIHLQAH
jgi:two-component system phosphate regulon sensor histidine kinase PhoR